MKSLWRPLRIVLLLLVLATVAQQAWLARTRAVAWNDPLRVAIYPVNGDGSQVADRYIHSIGADTFRPLEGYFAEESKRHGLSIHQPLRLTLAPQIMNPPPQPPQGASAPAVIVWSLRMRWWAWRNDPLSNGPKQQVRLYVQFFDPAQHPTLAHSTGLDRGMIGLVNAFATPAAAGSINVVIAHELLHTLGATDKYDPATNQPSFPDGYAEPQRKPSLPQTHAEIMAGRIPKSAQEAVIPDSLDATVIGPRTAAEIGWKSNQPLPVVGNGNSGSSGKP